VDYLFEFISIFSIAVASFVFIREDRGKKQMEEKYKRLFQYISYLVKVNDKLREENITLQTENKDLMNEVKRLEDELSKLLKTKPQDLEDK
jgi:cell division protein FtsB